MSLQTLSATIPALFLMVTSCTSQRSVEFLGFEGCPNTPELRERFALAQPSVQIIDVDLMVLDDEDTRLRWGAPTILVDGVDLFGMPPNENGSVSCRNWSNGIPTTEEINFAYESQQK